MSRNETSASSLLNRLQMTKLFAEAQEGICSWYPLHGGVQGWVAQQRTKRTRVPLKTGCSMRRNGSSINESSVGLIKKFFEKIVTKIS